MDPISSSILSEGFLNVFNTSFTSISRIALLLSLTFDGLVSVQFNDDTNRSNVFIQKELNKREALWSKLKVILDSYDNIKQNEVISPVYTRTVQESSSAKPLLNDYDLFLGINNNKEEKSVTLSSSSSSINLHSLDSNTNEAKPRNSILSSSSSRQSLLSNRNLASSRRSTMGGSGFEVKVFKSSINLGKNLNKPAQPPVVHKTKLAALIAQNSNAKPEKSKITAMRSPTGMLSFNNPDRDDLLEGLLSTTRPSPTQLLSPNPPTSSDILRNSSPNFSSPEFSHTSLPTITITTDKKLLKRIKPSTIDSSYLSPTINDSSYYSPPITSSDLGAPYISNNPIYATLPTLNRPYSSGSFLDLDGPGFPEKTSLFNFHKRSAQDSENSTLSSFNLNDGFDEPQTPPRKK